MSERIRVTAPEGGRVVTKQSMALESDVNAIVARYVQFGTLPVGGNGGRPMYGDFSDSMSLQEAMDRVIQAQSQFQALPAHIRDYCRNEPGRFLDLVFDPERRPELEKLGLVEMAVPEKALLVRLEAPLEPVDNAGDEPAGGTSST